MNFTKKIAFSLFSFLLVGVGSAAYSPINIESTRRYAENIEVTISNADLLEDESYYLYCEERVNRYGNFSYRAPDSRWQIKSQPKFIRYRYSDSLRLSVNGVKEDKEYKCTVSIRVEDDFGRQYLARTSAPVFVKTLTIKAPHYRVHKKGIQAEYLNRTRKKRARFVYPKPTKIVFRPMNYWNLFSWGPEYYMSSFFPKK